jgi:tRNA pseudouridine32 synthase / 23S rRNA pseudouridine746 synthase
MDRVLQTRPSRLYLPKMDDPPPTIFEHLLRRFPQVSPDAWRQRVSQGLVTLSDGAPLREDTAYRFGIMVYYRKHVPFEPEPIEEPLIVFRDEEIIVVDKPHGMPVTPAGEHVQRCLLARLEKMTALPDLAPMHRLDRDTAGLVLFTIRPDGRGRYHQLFAEGMIVREYVAAAHIPEGLQGRRWRIENRLEAGEPWYRQRIVEGAVNAVTEIELLDVRSENGRFRLIPKTGKKHQLRVHMASIGCPIIGDPFYPTINNKHEGDLPLQLIARSLKFMDPITGAPRSFTSRRELA